MNKDEIRQMILDGVPNSEVMIEGEGDHFQAVIVSAEFEGMSKVKQHQMVYRAIGDAMQSAIHALSIQTVTPEKWKEMQKFQVLQ